VHDAELFADDPADVAAPQRADPVGVAWAGIEPRFELLLLLGRELGRASGLLAGRQCVDAAGAIAGQPLVDEARGAVQTVGDLVAFQLVIDGQQHRAIAITLLGVGFAPGQFLKPLAIFGCMKDDCHETRLCQIAARRATEQAPNPARMIQA